jgi:excisionase family DNA binding protein
MNPEDQKSLKLSRYCPYLTRNEAAKYLRVTPQMIREHRKEITSHKIGWRYLYTEEELDGLVRPCARGGNFTNIFPWGLGSGRTYLTRREAVEHLGISMSWLKKYPKRVPAYKFFGRVLYVKEELDEIIRRNRRRGAS